MDNSQTNTLRAALAALVGGASTSDNDANTGLYVPLCDATGAVTNKITLASLAQRLWSFRTAISPGADLDDYTTPGVYVISGSAEAKQIANIPQAASSTLLVLMTPRGKGQMYAVQVLFPFSATNLNVWVRHLRPNGYTWWKLATE